MTLSSRLVALLPACFTLAAAHAAVLLASAPSLGRAAWLLFALYGAPVLAYRLHERFCPLEQGVSYLDGSKYSSWWGGHEIQSFYIAFPFLEAALRLVPGAYSAWLRLWGSRVGRSVYWTPRVEIADRGLLDLGDGVIFGHKVELFGHTVKASKRGRLLLYVRKLTVGAGAFIGAGSRLAPGVVVEEGSIVPILTDLYPNAKFTKDMEAAPAKEPA